MSLDARNCNLMSKKCHASTGDVTRSDLGPALKIIVFAFSSLILKVLEEHQPLGYSLCQRSKFLLGLGILFFGIYLTKRAKLVTVKGG